MSRARPVDNSATVSLFPFLAVLLCTMGALLVVLVGMTHSAKGVALRQAELREQPQVPENDPVDVQQVEQAKQYLAKLNELRAESDRKLREEHQRLSHLEAHMRRLREQFEKLQLAAAELESMEEEHYDDREQAEREIARLQQLITETRKAIDAIKEEQSSRKRAYALVPYEGPNGTTRRPIYIECRKGELILQPEGVRLGIEDLRPPVGPGNPLAAAVRAAREHLMTIHPEESVDRDSEPYPLVIVRPSGAVMFSPAQRAIQSGDFDFGYELVEEDWDLKYPPADPQLAVVEQLAIDQARIRQQALAAAAPRAYRHPALAAAGRFEFDGMEGGGMSFVERGGDGSTGDGAAGAFDSGDAGDGSADSVGPYGANGPTGEPGGPKDGSAGGVADEGATAGSQQAGGEQSAGPASVAANQSSPGAAGVAGAGAVPSEVQGGAGGNASSGSVSGSQMSSDVTAQNRQTTQQTPELAASRGADWALKRKKPRAVAVRRTIRIIVRDDHIAVLSDDAQLNERNPAGKTVSLDGDTVEAVDNFVKVVNEQIEGWGMAGDGLYWRPVLALHVGPDGQRRAYDLARLLKNSGLELQPATAQKTPQGNTRATR